ncbi:hypothetical protein N657DRAFT_678129 [Parathielavia appendiculata]|uniref:Uncharacterized protein n=1 Tax=Parathielavia appendiculata TaxID=2587402 RepID=A0AAN6Z731_9PEZI|nr:hypothetical protein N657DRAFT_678129 [Parathielavia appendiculata]
MEAKPHLAELYRRAVADPHSISRAERNAIWGHPPPEEEDRLCVAKTGLTRAGLVAKAAAQPDELTLCEAKIICHHRGVNFDDKAEEAAPITGIVDRLDRLEVALLEYIRVCKKKPTPLEKLYNEALARLCAVRSPEETTAFANALKRDSELAMADSEANEMKWREHEKARIVKVGTPWIRKMLEAGLLEDGAECWGFVVFRTGCYHGEENEALWQRFRDHLLKVAETSVLHWYSGPELWPSLRIVFVEDKELEGASNEQLRIWFRKMRDRAGGEQHLPKGIRTNCFLVADEAVIKSEAAQTPYTPRCKYMDVPEFGVEILDEDPVVYIRAVDPDYVSPGNPAPPAERTKEDTADKVPGTPTSSNSLSAAPAYMIAMAKQVEEEMADFKGEATVALPRVFDWLHRACFFAERGIKYTQTDGRDGWHTIHVQTKKPEAWVRNWSAWTGSINYAKDLKRFPIPPELLRTLYPAQPLPPPPPSS